MKNFTFPKEMNNYTIILIIVSKINCLEVINTLKDDK